MHGRLIVAGTAPASTSFIERYLTGLGVDVCVVARGFEASVMLPADGAVLAIQAPASAAIAILIEQLVCRDLPLVLLDASRIRSDAEYLFARVSSLVAPEWTAERARTIHAQLVLDSGDEAARALEDAYVELGTASATIDELQTAHRIALSELEQSRRLVGEQGKLLDQQSAYLRDLERLRMRANDNRRQLEREAIEAAERHGLLLRKHTKMIAAFETATHQIESLHSERAIIASYVNQLVVAVATARARMLEAQRSEHEALSLFVDDGGSVAPLADRVAFLVRFRRASRSLLDQLERMDEQIAEFQAARDWRRILPWGMRR